MLPEIADSNALVTSQNRNRRYSCKTGNPGPLSRMPNSVLIKGAQYGVLYIGGQDQSSNEEDKPRPSRDSDIEIMQPGRPFLRSLQSSILKHVQGKVHCESEKLRVSRRKQRCLRPERVDSDLSEAPLERSDIANRVLAAVKACSMVDSAKVTEDANFEEDLQLQRGDVVVLVLAVLKKYGLNLSYVEARRMTTCTELIDYIESQVCQDDSSSNEDH